MTLLEKANSYNSPKGRTPRKITAQHIELATAWARNEISYAQVKCALGFETGHGNSTHVYLFLAMALREVVKKL